MEDTESLIVFTNQLRVSAALSLAAREVTCGGHALRHYAAFRLKLERLRLIDDPVSRIATGFVSRISAAKNKLSVQGRAVEVDFMYGRGFVEPPRCLDGICANDGVMVHRPARSELRTAVEAQLQSMSKPH